MNLETAPLSQTVELMDTFVWHQFSYSFLILLLLLLMFLADGGGNFK